MKNRVDHNMRYLTKNQRIRILNKIIDSELEKPENEVDMKLVDQCMDIISKLNEGKYTKSKKQLSDDLNAIKSSEEAETRKLPVFKRRIVKAACVAFVLMFVLSTTITVMARVGGYGNPFDWIMDNMGTIFNWEPGTYDVGGITVQKGEASKYYDSIEEFLNKEELDILYPSSLPDGINLRFVSMTEYGDDKFDLTFAFDTNSIGFSVFNYDLSLRKFDTEDVITANGIEYTILHISDRYQANYVNEKYAYSITSYDYDDLIYLLNSMKEAK